MGTLPNDRDLHPEEQKTCSQVRHKIRILKQGIMGGEATSQLKDKKNSGEGLP